MTQDTEKTAGPTFKQFNAAILRTTEAFETVRGDDARQTLYHHLDRLLDAEIAYFSGAPTAPTDDDIEEEQPFISPMPEADAERIAAHVAEHGVKAVPAGIKKERKPSSMSPLNRWKCGERARKMQCERQGVTFVPGKFEDSRFANASDSDEPVAEFEHATQDNSKFNIPEPQEDDEIEGITTGGIEFRP